MKLVATILCGPDLSNLPRAVASVVDHVDEVILIDTAPIPVHAGTSQSVARQSLYEVCGDATNILIRKWPWQGRFDAARNEALALATEADGDFAITLDADEWYVGAEGLRALCASASPEIEAIHLRNGEASRYYQARVIRLPCARRWVGRTHEAIDFGGVRLKNDEIRFCSDPKTPEQVRAKSVRDLPLLLEEIAEKPEEGRWFMYLGHAYSNLADGLDGSDPLWAQAIEAYVQCAELHKNREEKALAHYYAANIAIRKRLEYEGGIQFLVRGMAAHAGIPELPYLAASTYLTMAPLQVTEASAIACVEQALYFAEIARVHGEGSDAIANRIQHVDPEAATVGPLRVLAECFRIAGATERERQVRDEIEARIRQSS